MSNDAVRWDEKYRHKAHPDVLEPDPLLVEYLDLFRPGQLVVDLASGSGRNALLLAGNGCQAIPLDCSLVALQKCSDHADNAGLTVYPVAADLTQFRFPPECLDGLVCFNYLNRALSDNICAALRPGGHLIMKTFNENFLAANPRFNPDYVLAAGELTAMFDGLEIKFLEDNCQRASVTKSAIVARKAFSA